VRLLVEGDLVEDLLLGGGEVRDLDAAGDGTRARAGVRRGQTAAGGGTEVELGFEVLEIEGEVEDVGVSQGRFRGGWRGGRGAGGLSLLLQPATRVAALTAPAPARKLRRDGPKFRISIFFSTMKHL